MLLDWITVMLLIAIGLVLIVVELIFVPGTTFVGIIGFILTAVGIWLGYSSLGSTVGHVILGSSVLVGVVSVFYSFRSDAWSRFALKGQINSRVNDEYKHELFKGETGLTISALRPAGTAVFRERQHEVHTSGEFVDANTQVRIIKIEQNRIIVEEIS